MAVAVVLVMLTSVLVVPPPQASAAASFEVVGSVEQVFVTELAPGASVELLDPDGATIRTGVADALGAVRFGEVRPGDGLQVPPADGYRVRVGGTELSEPVEVLGPTDHPDQSFYDGQTIDPGYGYLETRDGTPLSVNVVPPLLGGGPGPWPVLVEYSGYTPSNPGGQSPFMLAATLSGFAYVGVNMRGTGCSGGAFHYFEWLQSLDGYDVIETIAAQPWSENVGMAGISYPGISQLFVAQTRPPNLAAISPLSVIADTYRSTLYPGGILNDGFALDWATDRQEDAEPRGQGWAADRIDDGDTTCEDNQDLRLQSQDVVGLLEHDLYYEAAGDQLAPRTFVDEIDVPTFIAGAWQDEQTGGHFPTMLDDFAADTQVRALLTNGTHTDALSPEGVTALMEFLSFYVAEEIPEIPQLVRDNVGILYQEILGVSDIELPPDRFTAYDDYGAALSAYEAEDPVRVIWENGAGDQPGYPIGTHETSFSEWPPPDTAPWRLYLGPDGALTGDPPTVGDEPRGSSSYRYDPGAQPEQTFSGGSSDIWEPLPDVDWQPIPDGSSLAFVSEPLTEQMAMAGSGSVDLWLASTAADSDVEVTLTEVRPDGRERYVQNGWLRASHRKLDPAATPLEPMHTHLAADAQPLPADGYAPVRIELFPFAHVFRPGSRIRLTVEAPGGNRPFWTFDAQPPTGETWNTIAHHDTRPSSILLPVQPTVDAPDSLPACPSLRNQPCRHYEPAPIATGVTATDTGDGLLVSWEPPEGDVEVESYRVRVNGSDEVHVVDGSTTQVLHPDVVDDREYWFTVEAVLADGVGPPSSPSAVVVRESPAPTTTTTTTTTSTTSTTSTTVPVTASRARPDRSSAPAGGSQGAPPVTEASRTTLPVTGGPSIVPLGVAAVMLLASGVVVRMVARRRERATGAG